MSRCHVILAIKVISVPVLIRSIFQFDNAKILETFEYKFKRQGQQKRKRNPVKYNLESALSVVETCDKISI
ncbi:MAG: hypothetical protein EWV55_07025 [Microcystis viridis Mv_BB_P_19951000_S69]|uniref:Uncharacterized protein n=1 Tax=Microcystis viridis Mv_BB_P_19951000_S68D TaxID=2486270 RepID=A0A552HJV2_MICVR|nr:MAG: hypothetical protein EWV77_15175 [Microcystis viridis Mv_BB_P_19951000_S68D]TRU72714.1 MAG: hypothetical protein EWV47_14595 [Microcystis viridis Mv_BB_P_19951000_S68]TRU76534.1 MAG: hypothetical protein EWV55_07025 [Microcystis viridis Mv_BB_P_19951000_S69]